MLRETLFSRRTNSINSSMMTLKASTISEGFWKQKHTATSLKRQVSKIYKKKSTYNINTGFHFRQKEFVNTMLQKLDSRYSFNDVIVTIARDDVMQNSNKCAACCRCLPVWRHHVNSDVKTVTSKFCKLQLHVNITWLVTLTASCYDSQVTLSNSVLVVWQYFQKLMKTSSLFIPENLEKFQIED